MKRRLFAGAAASAAAIVLVCAVPARAAWIDPPRSAAQPRKLAPYVSSPISVIDKMLEAASLRGGETLYDLGCGDGRIVMAAAKNFGAHAVGVEISDSLAQRARQQALTLGLQDQVRIITADMMGVDISSANVVSLYLMTEANDTLKPKLERELKPGSRVEKVELHNHPYTIYVYLMPQR